jgi:hypothetical protein
MFADAAPTLLPSDLPTVLDLVTKAGAGGVLVFVVWLFYTERIMPRSTVDKLLGQRDAEVQRAWRERDEAVGIAQAQAKATEDLVEIDRQVLDAIRRMEPVQIARRR